MKEFKPLYTMADWRARIEAESIEAGICEVYECDWHNLDRWNTDYVGEFNGDDLAIIPDHAEVRWTTMDVEEYASTLLANCSGDAEDYVCEETGKVLVVQYYVPTAE